MIKGYRDLLVWRKAMDLATESYRLSAIFPVSESGGLMLHLRKAAVSVPTNIAEGRGRRSTREFIRFLDIAYGSLMELQTHLLLADRLGFCRKEVTDFVFAQSEEVARMLNGLRASLRRRDSRAKSVPFPLTPES